MGSCYPLLRSTMVLAVLLCAVFTLHAGSNPVKEGYSAFKREAWGEAYGLWMPEAEKGDARAQYYLSTLFSLGLGREKDQAQAFELLSLSSESGFAPAQYALGNSYKNGWHVKKDLKQAVHWWEKSAKQGFARAQYSLGVLHYLGKGVKKDYKRAVTWYRRAALAGSSEARQTLKRLNVPLKPESLGQPISTTPATSPVTPESSDDRKLSPPPEPIVVETGGKSAKKLVFKDSDFDPNVAMEKKGLNLSFTTGDYDGLSKRSDLEKSDEMRLMASRILGRDDAEEESEPIPQPQTANLSEAQMESLPVNVVNEVTEDNAEAKTSTGKDQGSVVALTADEKKISYSRGLAWIEEQQPDHYTLQLFSSNKRDNTYNFFKLLKSDWPTAIFSFEHSSGEPWYGVIIGSFTGYSEAKAAEVGFSAGRGGSITWIREFGGIQQTLVK
ncbi:MAG: SPOR domain-containing protein [Candidatus Sedimenticola sp. (ex Thyasira tokunagai)]